MTSAGIAATEALANRLQLNEGREAWQRVLESIPVLREQFRDARATQPFRHIPRLGFRSATVAGKNWALLPSAAGFVDPLLSTGFPLTLLGVMRLAEILERDWKSERFHLGTYAAQTDGELMATARLIGASYENLGDFPALSAILLL